MRIQMKLTKTRQENNNIKQIIDIIISRNTVQRKKIEQAIMLEDESSLLEVIKLNKRIHQDLQKLQKKIKK